jgi:hypothetical protein
MGSHIADGEAVLDAVFEWKSRRPTGHVAILAGDPHWSSRNRLWRKGDDSRQEGEVYQFVASAVANEIFQPNFKHQEFTVGWSLDSVLVFVGEPLAK